MSHRITDQACTVTYPSDPIFPILTAITQFQQDQEDTNIALERTKGAEVSALQDECKTLVELVRKRDVENRQLHKRAKEVQEESEEILAGKVAEGLRSHRKDMFDKNKQIETLKANISIQSKMIQGMSKHMVMKSVLRPEMSDSRLSLKRRASAADLDAERCLR